jgi:hypothetical protein
MSDCQHDDCERPAVAEWNGCNFCDEHVRERLRTTADTKIKDERDALAAELVASDSRLHEVATGYATAEAERDAVAAELATARDATVPGSARMFAKLEARVQELQISVYEWRDRATVLEATLRAAQSWLFDDGGSRICDEETAQLVNDALSPQSETDCLHRRGRDTTLECAAIRLLESIAKLGEFEPASKLTYFEESPTKNGECQKRWLELNDAGALVKRVLADRKSSEPTTSEPGAAR